MTEQNYSMTDVLNLAGEIKELADFQNSAIWSSEAFTFNFQQEYIEVLVSKADELESLVQELEFKVIVKIRN
jgi:ribosomal protein S18 acetylase RimI-like enzyme